MLASLVQQPSATSFTLYNSNASPKSNCVNGNSQLGQKTAGTVTSRSSFSINNLLSTAKFSSDDVITIATASNPIASSEDNTISVGFAMPASTSGSENSANQSKIIQLKSAEIRAQKRAFFGGGGGSSKRLRAAAGHALGDVEPPPNCIRNGAPPQLAVLRCQLELENRQLWTKFERIGTEMIITKLGRRMFPTVKVRLENCDPSCDYYVYMDIIPVDLNRYRYAFSKSSWCYSGEADVAPPNRLYMHPESPFSGAELNKLHTISFEKVKLTNNLADNNGHLVLNSMHKYQPRVHVVPRHRALPPLENGGRAVDLTSSPICVEYKTFQFPETRFMAVTAYQNQLVTQMKIEKNPFAKGFRDPGTRGTHADLLESSMIFGNMGGGDGISSTESARAYSDMMQSSMNGSNGENTSALQNFAATILQHHQQQQAQSQSQQPTKPTMELLYLSALKNGTNGTAPPTSIYGNGTAIPISTNQCSSRQLSQSGNFYPLFQSNSQMLLELSAVPDSISLRNQHQSQHQQQWLMMQYLMYASRLMASGNASNSIGGFRDNRTCESHHIHSNCDTTNKDVANDQELEVRFAVDDLIRHSSPIALIRAVEATNKTTPKPKGTVRQTGHEDQPSTSILDQAEVEEEEKELNENERQSDCWKGLNEESDRKQMDDIMAEMNPAKVVSQKFERSKSITPDETAWKPSNKVPNHRHRIV